MEIAVILDECLERLRRGETVEECLARYPARAQELEPLLRVAAQLYVAPRPRLAPAVRFAMQEQLHRAIAAKRPRPARRPLMVRFAFTMALLLAVILTGASLVNVAAGSLPGDFLYPAKRVAEDARLTLTWGAAARARLHLERAQARLTELERLLHDEGRYDADTLAALEAETAQALTEIARAGGVQGSELLGQFLAIVRAQRAFLSAAAAEEQDPVARLSLEAAAVAAAREEAWADYALQNPQALVPLAQGTPLPNEWPPAPSPTAATATPLAPTPTATWTATRTPTLTRTPSPTMTEVAGAEGSPTPSPSPTATPTATPTRARPTPRPTLAPATPTPQPTPVQEATPTPLPPTPAPRPTATPTAPPTPTFSPTPRPTATPRPTPTPSATPTITEPTPTPTVRPTKTPVKPTRTPTPRPRQTRTPPALSPTPEETETPEATDTPGSRFETPWPRPTARQTPWPTWERPRETLTPVFTSVPWRRPSPTPESTRPPNETPGPGDRAPVASP